MGDSMATAVLMPRQGNTVETCQILEWRKAPGESVSEGEILCLVETDKATFEVESPRGGVLLERFFEEGDDVPVLTTIAVVGKAGEDYADLKPVGEEPQPAGPQSTAPQSTLRQPVPAQPAGPQAESTPGKVIISPRARRLARAEGVSLSAVSGTGPGGRIIERDIRKALSEHQPLTPAAREVLMESGGTVPSAGTGIGGRILSTDIRREAPSGVGTDRSTVDQVTTVPVKGIRKRIAEKMLQSLQSTAQLTLNCSADAVNLLAYRKKLKSSPDSFGLQGITINDLVLFAISRILPYHSALNALYDGEEIFRYENVHLAFAVDSPRGLVVPVIRNAQNLSLKQLAGESKRLSQACLAESIGPDDLKGGTFTVTNLGHLGVESFTPILNPPQVAILGVSTIQPKAVQKGEEVVFLPHIGLSLTINHQVVDGAPAAYFLKALSEAVSQIDIMLST